MHVATRCIKQNALRQLQLMCLQALLVCAATSAWAPFILGDDAILGGEFPIREYEISDSRPAFRPMAMCDDPLGMVYAGGQSGVHRFDGVRWNRLFEKEARVLLSDGRASIYVAGGDGVYRFTATSLYDPQAIRLIGPEDSSVYGELFEDIARINNDIFVTNTEFCVRFRIDSEGRDEKTVFTAEEQLPSEWKFRSVREIGGRPLFLLESRSNYLVSRFAWLEDGQFNLLNPLRNEDGSLYEGGIIEFVPLPESLDDRNRATGDAVALVFRARNRLYKTLGGVVRDITPELIASRDSMILRLNALPDGRFALLARGVGYAIVGPDGKMLNLLPAEKLPAFWTTSFIDRSGRVWIPGENAMHRVDYQAGKAFWSVPNGETVYSLGFIGRDFLLVGTHSNAYYAPLTQLQIAGQPRLVPARFQTLGVNLGRTKDIEIIESRPYFATLQGIFTWDPTEPEKPAELVIEGAFHNIVYDSKTQRLFAFGIWRQPSLVLTRTPSGTWQQEATLPSLLRPTEDPVQDSFGTIWAIGHRLKPQSRQLHRIDVESLETSGIDGKWKPVVFAGDAYAVNDDGGFASFYEVRKGGVATSEAAEFKQLFTNPAANKWMGSVIDSSVMQDGSLLVSTDRESVLRFSRATNGELKIDSVFGGFVQGIGRTPIEGPDGTVWAGVRDRIYRSELPLPRPLSEEPARVWISAASIANSVMPTDGTAPGDRPLKIVESETNASGGFEVACSYDYEVGTLRINFGVPAAVYPEGVVYRSRMVGLNDAWSEFSRDTTREFPALVGGDYRFEVEAILTDGRQLPATTLAVKVFPPWYRTPLFYATCFAFAFAAGFGFLRWKIWVERKQVAALRREVKEREEAESKLVRYQNELVRRERLRALGEMAAGVAHDLNNSLTPILAFSGLLARNDGLVDPKRTELAELIEKSATDAAAIVRRLSPLYRAGNLPRTTQNLRELISDVVKSTTEQVAESDKDIQVIDDAQDIIYNCCASDVREVLTNLVHNGIDAIESSGRLTVSCYEDNGVVVLKVTDTGAGMSPEQAERCLEAFYTAKDEKGSGLGLAVCDSVVRSYGGKIVVRSQLGNGTTVSVYLPHTGEPLPSESQVEEGVLPVMKVLLVEDYRSTRESIKVLLEVLNQDVVEAENAQQATDLLNANQFDLLLTDNSLPGESGFELCQRLRQREQRPVLIITSGHEQSGLREACDAFLAKPVSLNQLHKAIEAAIEIHRARQPL